jgi:hypothetical protein
MADNVAYTPGSGATVAADDIGGVLHQRVKISVGADGAAADLAPGQAAMANSLPVALASDQSALAVTVATIPSHAVTNAGTFAVQAAEADGANVTLGAKADAKSTATDATAISAMSVLKQVSASAQLSATAAKQPALGTAGTASADVITVQGVASMTPVSAVTPQVTVDLTVTRPADTTTYAVNDALSDSTSAPTSGGFTFTNAARLSGGAGTILEAFITSTNDPAALLQGELWLFDQAITNVNDNAAFSISDGDVVNAVGVIPFTMASTMNGSGNNSYAHIMGLGIGFNCVGTANLRALVKVKNAYVPANAEALKIRLKILQG